MLSTHLIRAAEAAPIVMTGIEQIVQSMLSMAISAILPNNAQMGVSESNSLLIAIPPCVLGQRSRADRRHSV